MHIASLFKYGETRAKDSYRVRSYAVERKIGLGVKQVVEEFKGDELNSEGF